MRKIFTLFIVFTAILSSSLFAQCNPEFTFTVNQSSGNVQFSPLNSAAVEHQWLFGDGTSSNTVAPLHVYVPGAYNVVHVVTYRSPNDSNIVQCIDSAVQLVTVTNQEPCNIHASYTFTRDSIQSNKVYFNNLSTGGNANTVTSWSFGDGTSSYEQNPIHVYGASRAYTVCLTVMRDNVCADTFCSIVQVQVPTAPCNLVVNFTSTVDSLHPNTVYFNNLSTPLASTDSVIWYFGDGTMSYDISPSHTYTGGGTYTVYLIVNKNTFDSSGTPCTGYFYQVITTGGVCNIEPGFAFSRDTTTTAFPATYSFYNTSAALTNIDSSFWDFGDNTAVVINPGNPLTHTYTAPGAYTVCLKIKKVQPGSIDVICERQTCQAILVDTPQIQCNLQAYFSYYFDSVFTNKIYFSNQSVPTASTDSISWNFGDGHSSTLANPDHTYSDTGYYQVCLRVKKVQAPGAAPCVAEYCNMVFIQPANPCNLTVSFTDSVFGNSVYFSNYITPFATTDSIRWTFGDGTGSADINPLHTYNVPGTYQVCLRVKKAQTSNTAPCIREYCSAVVIEPDCNMVVDFEYESDSVSGTANTIHFTNTSTGLLATDSSFWNFSDGTLISYEPSTSFTHTFPGPGTYMVCLWERRYIPGTTTLACVRESCKAIVVSEPSNVCDQLQVNFNWHIDSANNRKVYFINQSSPLTANTFTNWSFGDGDSSTAASPDHIYPQQPGNYRVCLVVKMATCIKEFCQTVTIVRDTTNDCTILPTFTTSIDAANRRKIYFNNTTTDISSALGVGWSFGDGYTASGVNAEHEYTMPGWYLVCVNVTSSNNCNRSHCDSVFVPGNVISPVACDTFQLSIGQRQDDYMPNKFYFFATGNAPLYSELWTINAINDTTSAPIYQSNPVYVFPDTGYYKICVRGYFSTNCYKEFCDYIRINSTNTSTQCVVNAYPNPAHDNVSFNIQLDAPGPIVAAVYNTAGIAQLQYTQTGVTGNNLVTLTVQNLVAGFYTVRIMYNGRVCYTRFQKM